MNYYLIKKYILSLNKLRIDFPWEPKINDEN